jgi:hypothetical protein
MSYNAIYNQTIQNVLLSKNLYAKHILRYKKSKDLGFIDSSSDFSNAFIKNGTNLGESIYYDVKNFRHRNYKELRLKTYSPFNQLNNSYEHANKLKESINSIINNKSKNYINILSPIKGGFYGHCSGIYGFIPKSQMKNMISKTLNSSLAGKSNLSNQIYFSNLHEMNNWLKPRTKFKLSKVSITPYSITNNFVARKKRRIFKNKLNFVFIAE